MAMNMFLTWTFETLMSKSQKNRQLISLDKSDTLERGLGKLKFSFCFRIL